MPVRSSARKNYCWALPCFSAASSPALALADAKNALVLDPASAYRWADLAEAELNANHVDDAKYALRNALAAGPGSPAVLFRAARFYLRLEDYPETVAKLTSILRNPDLSDYYFQVFSIYRQMDMPLSEILSQGIPRNRTAASGFLSFWIEGNQMDEAQETWTWLKQNSLADVDAAAEYVSFLAKNNMPTEAVQMWADFNAKNDPSFRKNNWVFNGSFETDPADCPFDWTIKSNSELNASVERGVNYGGASALKIVFSSLRKSTFRIIYQDTILAPGSWTLRGFMRTTHIKSEQGLYFHIIDPDNSSRLDVSTNGFEGTEEWSSQEKTFSVSAGSRLVRIELISPISKNVTDDLANVWVDHIEVIPAH